MVNFKGVLAVAIAALALSLVAALSWGLWERGRAKVLAERVEGLEGALRASQAQAHRRAKTDPKQALAQAEHRQAVQAVLDSIRQEEAHEAKEPRPVASPVQLDRLRKLHAASTAAVRSASELP